MKHTPVQGPAIRAKISVVTLAHVALEKVIVILQLAWIMEGEPGQATQAAIKTDSTNKILRCIGEKFF
jgi:hypothetical protein